MSFVLCLELMRNLGKTQYAAVALATQIATKKAVEASLNYRVNDDLYYYNQTNFTLYLIGPGGTLTSQGVAS